jgi:hypothetical protein
LESLRKCLSHDHQEHQHVVNDVNNNTKKRKEEEEAGGWYPLVWPLARVLGLPRRVLQVFEWKKKQ